MIRSAPACAAALAAALFPALALGQALSIGAEPEPGGAVIGRVCLDRDADGRCGPGDPGVAGARVLAEGGQIAVADREGRFHLLEVPGRVVLADRVAYGGHAVAARGLGVRRSFELGPAGAAAVDLAIPAPPRVAPPALASAAAPGRAPARQPEGGLRWDLGGRTTPGARVSVGGAEAVAGADGAFAVEVLLVPGENELVVVVAAPDGGGAVFGWRVSLVPRPRGGDLVAPALPERLATLSVQPRPGGALLVGRAEPGRRLRLGGLAPLPGEEGDVAAFVVGATAPVEVLDAGGRPIARAAPALPDGGGLRALAGLGEVEVSFLGDPDVLVTGRGAAAVEARIGRVDVAAGVDLDDRDRHGSLADLLRPRDGLVVEHALDPERSLWTAGDESAADDRNPGRGRVWARVQAEGARLDVGGARAGLTGSEVGRYDRALHGARARAERTLGPVALEASAFGATLREDAGGSAPPVPAHDVLSAVGGAAFWLAHGEVVPGSEALRIEWRDPVTGRLSDGRRLVRGVDYEIDWATGRVVLAAPLSSVGATRAIRTQGLAAADRAVLVADYLHAAAGSAAEDLRGGRVGASVGPLSLSVHAAAEERPEGPYRLEGGAAVLDLGPLLSARVEAARSEGALFARGRTAGFSRAVDGGYVFGGGSASADREADAIHLEARSAAGPVRALGWWRERGAGYSDAEFDETRSARERGAEVSAEEGAWSGALLFAERRGADPDDPAGLRLEETRSVLARAGWAGERFGLLVEGLRAERDAPRRGEETSAGVRGSWRVEPSLTLDLAHHQGIQTTGAGLDPTFTSGGATFQRGRSALSVRSGWGPELGPRLVVAGARGGADEAVYGTFTTDADAPDVLSGEQGASALGARQRAGSAEIFTEEQFARDALGLRASRLFGAAIEPARGLRLSVTAERGERRRPDGSRRERGAVAGVAGLVRGPLRVALRGEVRTEGDDAQAGAGASAEWVASRAVTLGLRSSWLQGEISGREALGFDAAASGAFRSDRRSLLASVARIAEMRPGAARRDAWIGRLAGTASLSRRIELGLGAALAVQEVAGGRDDRITGSARARVQVVGPLDAAVEYARRAPLDGGDLGALDAVRAEAGVTQREGRLAVGYTLVGFGGDGLTPAADTGRLYVRAQVTY